MSRRVRIAAAFVWPIARGYEELASWLLGCMGSVVHECCLSSRHPLTAEGTVFYTKDINCFAVKRSCVSGRWCMEMQGRAPARCLTTDSVPDGYSPAAGSFLPAPVLSLTRSLPVSHRLEGSSSLATFHCYEEILATFLPRLWLLVSHFLLPLSTWGTECLRK